jgi:hypothetical protein
MKRPAIEAHRRSGQKIFHRQAADLANLNFAIDDVEQVRQRLDWDLERLEGLDNRSYRRGVGVRDRDQHLVRPALLQNPRQVISSSQHRHAVDPPSHFRRVVIHETDRMVRELLVGLHVSDDQLGRVAGAEDEDALAALAGVELCVDPVGQADADEEQCEQQCVDDEDRARVDGRSDRGLDDDPEDSCADRHPADDRQQVVHARITPQPFIEPERDEREDADGEEPGHHLPPRLYRPVGRVAVEPQQERGVIRDDHQHELRAH